MDLRATMPPTTRWRRGRHCGIRFALPRMIPRARETTCCILLIIFVSYLSHKQLHVCFRVRAILCSPIFASGQPPLEATPSLMAERMNVVSYVYNLYLFLRFLFGVNVLGSRCSLFSRFFLFDFPDCASKKTPQSIFTAKHHRLVFGLFFDCLSTRRAEKKRKKCIIFS